MDIASKQDHSAWLCHFHEPHWAIEFKQGWIREKEAKKGLSVVVGILNYLKEGSEKMRHVREMKNW